MRSNPTTPGSRATWLIVLPRPTHGDGSPVTLVLTTRAHGEAIERTVIELPPGDTLEARVAAAFGGRMRRLTGQ